MSRPSALPVSTVMPPIDEDEVDLGLREVAGRLVGGDAVFVEPADLRPRLVDDDVVAVHGEAVGAGEAGRAAADHGDALPGGRGTGEGMLAGFHQRVGGVALQLADAHRLALGRLADAGLLAQRLGRADAGAHAAEDVRARGSFPPRPSGCRSGSRG